MDPHHIIITSKKITARILQDLCQNTFGDMVKVVVDVEKCRIGIGGELHADAEEMLIHNGSSPEDLWGANFYPWHEPDDRIEYSALINIRPRQDNASLEILDSAIRERMKKIIEDVIMGPDERLV